MKEVEKAIEKGGDDESAVQGRSGEGHAAFEGSCHFSSSFSNKISALLSSLSPIWSSSVNHFLRAAMS